MITTEQYGCQTGFGYPVGVATYDDLLARGWRIARIGIDHRRPDREMLGCCIAEVVDAGLQPLVLGPIHPAPGEYLMRWVPDGLDIEYYGLTPDLTIMGAEADLQHRDPLEFAGEVEATMAESRARGQRVWAPALSNPSRDAFAWMRRFMSGVTSSDLGITLHRYTDYGMKKGGDGRRGFSSLRDELTQFRAIIGPQRTWAMTEGSWYAGKYWRWEGDLYKAFDKIFPGLFSYRISDTQAATNTAEDWRIMREMGAAYCIWYQLGGDEVGLRRNDGTWKPQADIPRRTR